jgi:hypothetical protein
MQRSGHFEFGLDRRPINLGDSAAVQSVLQAWAAGEEIRGWARYWSMVYAYIHRLLSTDAQVRKAALVVSYEGTCASPEATLKTVLEHCRLPDAGPIIERYAATISYPSYYKCHFTPDEMAVIREETAGTASLWGY